VAERSSSWRRRLSGLRIDTTPLRTSRDFRLLFAAGTVFYLGGMVSYVALPYQVWQLTGSNFAVGAMGLVTIAPLIVFGLYGGALADHLDRRKTLIATGIAQAVILAVVLTNSANGLNLCHEVVTRLLGVEHPAFRWNLVIPRG